MARKAATLDQLIDEWRGLGPVGWCQNPYGWIGEDGKPITLSTWQGVVLSEYWRRRAEVSTLFVSTVKKTGKTLLNSLLTCYRWLTLPGLHYCIANDKDQTTEIQFRVIADMVKRHPLLGRYVAATKDTLTFEPTGGRIVALPMDYAGAAGGNYLTTSWSELWAYRYEANQRLFEELTVLPLVDSLRVIDSYAGFEGESELLRQVWERGSTGERVSDEWPIYQSGGLLAYIHQGEDAQVRCWRGTSEEREAYYQEQRATLRPMTYRRLHLNEWQSGEEQFLNEGQLSAVIVPGLSPLRPSDVGAWTGGVSVAVLFHDGQRWITPERPKSAGPRLSPLVVGLDLATKQDHAACVAVTWDYARGKARLAWHRVWRPSVGSDVDLGGVESYLLQANRDYHIGLVVFDPFQAAYLAQRLEAAGLPMREYPQTLPNLKRAAESLYSLIHGRRIALYDEDEIKRYLLNAKVKELLDGSGYRLVKPSAGRKIDLAVALAWACAELLDLYADFEPQEQNEVEVNMSKQLVSGKLVEVQDPPLPLSAAVTLRRVGGVGWLPIQRRGGLYHVAPDDVVVLEQDDARRALEEYPGAFEVVRSSPGVVVPRAA